MKIKKLTLTSRSFDVLYDYKKKNRSFWDDLAGLLRGQKYDPVVEARGNMQCFFYLPADDDADLVSVITRFIRDLGPDPTAFSISEPTCVFPNSSFLYSTIRDT